MLFNTLTIRGVAVCPVEDCALQNSVQFATGLRWDVSETPLWVTRFTRNVLTPSWILGFGVVMLVFPPQGVATSLSLLVLGLVVVPALSMASGTERLVS